MIKDSRLVITIFLLLLLSIVSTSFADGEGSAGQPGEFMRWGVGARSLGMGRAYTSLASGCDAIIWNPAGLGGVEKWQVSFMHAIGYENSRLDYLGFMMPIGKIGKFGIGWLNMGVNEFDGRDDYNQPTGDFSFANSAYMLAYGKWFWHNRFKLGLSTQFNQQKMDAQSASGWIGFNIGLLSKNLMRKLKLGLSINNIGAQEVAGDEYPMVVRTGLNYMIMRNFIISADLDFISGRDIFPRIGAEYRWGRALILRSGYDGNELTFGLGYDFGALNLVATSVDFGGRRAQVDYAGGLMNNINNNFTRFSIDFSGKEKYSIDELLGIEDPCQNLSEYEPLLYKYNVIGAAANLIFGKCYFEYESKEASLESGVKFDEIYGYFKEAYIGKFGDDWKNKVVTDEVAKTFFSQKTHYMFGESYMHAEGFSEKTVKLLKDLIFAGGDSAQYDLRLQYDLAITYKTLGKLDSARIIFNTIKENAGDDDPIKALALYSLAQLLKEGNATDRAIAITNLEKITEKYQVGFYNDDFDRLSYPMFPKYKDNSIVDEAHILLGDIKYEDGEIEAALHEYMQVMLFFSDLSSWNQEKAYQKSIMCFEKLGKGNLAKQIKARLESL